MKYLRPKQLPKKDFQIILSIQNSYSDNHINLYMQIWQLLISINWISSTKEMNPITRKSMSKLVM